MPPLSVPTSSALPPSLLIPSTDPAIPRLLSKLSRPALLSLTLDWLDDRNQSLSAPFLVSPDDDDADDLHAGDFYPPHSSLEDLREFYTELQSTRGTRTALLDRLLTGDYRHGLTLYQLAMADTLILQTHPTSQKWSAYALTPSHSSVPPVPRFHPPTFLKALQRALPPDIKAHYNLDRPPRLPLLLLRVMLLDTPYATTPSLSGAKVVYVAFPDASPHIFLSAASSPPATTTTSTKENTARDLRRALIACLPTALSRPRERYTLASTNLSARSLEAMIALRGGGRTGKAQGGWGGYALSGKKAGDTPLESVAPVLREVVGVANKNVAGEVGKLVGGGGEKDGKEEDEVDLVHKVLEGRGRGMKRPLDPGAETAKRRRLIAAARFGDVPSAPLELVDVRIEDPFPGEKEGGWCPSVRVAFRGSDVFKGVRALVERGVVEGERMPGWMTGEGGVSGGVVRGGRVGG
ncbi:hypothetical protein VC83_03937 [Pseudogymnoascus destructans]|uniref:CHL4 family chromosome segregation protein n=2 Tax=Pseudogymnoascus destructans TaxID=655981 RepID=L8FQA7_PSED2|nr:uncharacterized protein VC83_03937 [Pseudogymnoascus destructans]ELR01901.1 hypothetical protein GMDG_05083 [Pseudogymnoascus destructans 20631-21]OAF59498.1 hypothetical protein VC83_03937 [Pseudogymnoascus destructans]